MNKQLSRGVATKKPRRRQHDEFHQRKEIKVKTAIVAILLATAISVPASAGGIKIDRPCGTRGAEPCIVLVQRQTYPSDLKHYEMYAARRALKPAPAEDTSQTTIVTTYSIQTSRR